MLSVNLWFSMLLLLPALFMGGLATVTCLQVLRLRNPRLSWRAGTFWGLPLFSTFFLGISFILVGALWFFGNRWELVAGGCYLLFSLGWFVSSYFSAKRYITDHGIVKNVNDPAQTIAWHQIYDFFEQEKAHDHQYIFMYREQKAGDPGTVIRLPLQVPKAKHKAFKNLLSHKLGRRISCYEGEIIDVEQFE